MFPLREGHRPNLFPLTITVTVVVILNSSVYVPVGIDDVMRGRQYVLFY